MENNPLLQEIANMRQSLFDEKHLDQQFIQLEELEDVDNPNFVEEVVALYFRDSARVITTVEQELEKASLNFITLEKLLHQFKGSSASLGANKVMTEINQLRECLKEGSIEKSKDAFQQMKTEHENLKKKLETYFKLKQQALPVEIGERPEWDDEDGDE